MNSRESWLIYWAEQFHYIDKVQKKQLEKHKNPEVALKQMLDNEKYFCIEYCFVLQTFLQYSFQIGKINKQDCNAYIAKKVKCLKEGKRDYILHLEKYNIDALFVQRAFYDLYSQHFLERRDLSFVQVMISMREESEKEDIFPGYRILKKIGEGGMGVVFKALQQRTEKVVAIKAIKQTGVDKESHLKRFYREIEITSTLKHPGIIDVVEFYPNCKMPYLVMEYIEGYTLLDYIKTCKPPIKKKMEILEQLLYALEYAHQKQIFHRDIKPSNILIKRDGTPILMDFGLAKNRTIVDKSLTQSGQLIGTPPYMAPEQARGEKREFDSQTDIYQMGAVLYHILTGKPPASGNNMIEVLHEVVDKKASFDGDKVPRKLKNICKKALEKKKQDRYASAKDFALDLRNYIEGNAAFATKFYKKQMGMKCIKVIFALLFLACVIRYFPLGVKKKKLEYNDIVSLYRQARKEENIETAYMKFLQIFDLIKERKEKKYRILQKRLVILLIKNLQKQGQKQEKNSPMEALISYYGALKYIERYSSPRLPFVKLRDQTKMYLAMTYFRIKNYKKAYELGSSIQHHGYKENLCWILAVSSYYCEYDDALKRMIFIENTFPENSQKYIGSLYYQGIIHYRKMNYALSQKKLSFALKCAKTKYDFSDTLIIHYIACKFVYFTKKWSDRELYEIQELLQCIKKKQILQSIIYKETLAKYYLAKIKKQMDKNIAQKAINILCDCIALEPDRAKLYLLRAKFYRYVGEYELAFKDCDQCYFLNPNDLENFIEQFKIMEHSTNPLTIQKIIEVLPKRMKRAVLVEVDIFSKEFEGLRKYYDRIHFSSNRSIPFSLKKFHYYYKKMLRNASYIEAISLMTPSDKVYKLLMEKKGEASRKDLLKIAVLLKSIKERKKKRKEQELFTLLSQRKFLTSSHISTFLKNRAFLEKIAFGSYNYENNNELLIRFNICKVLAHIKSYRLSLIQRLTSSSLSIPTRIILAKALYEEGITDFSKDFLLEYLQQCKSPLLRAFIVSMLAPGTSKLKKTLCIALEDENLRVRVIAASRFIALEDKSIEDKVLMTLLQGCQGKNEYVRAFSYEILLSEVFSDCIMKNKLHVAEKVTPYIIRALDDSSELVKFLILSNIRHLQSRGKVDTALVRKKLRKSLKNSSSPLMHYCTIIALGVLEDKIAFDIAFDMKRSEMERLAGLSGIANSKQKNHFVQSLITFKKEEKTSVNSRFISFLFYFLAYGLSSAKLSNQTPMDASLLFALLGETLEENLKSKDIFIKTVTILSFYNLFSVPKKLEKKLQYLAKDTTLSITLRALAFGAFISSRSRRSIRADFSKYHTWVKKHRGNDMKSRLYRKALVDGYSSFARFAKRTHYFDLLQRSNSEKLRYFSFQAHIAHIKNYSHRERYSLSFRRIIDILLGVEKLMTKEINTLEECTLILAQIAILERKYREGIELVRNSLEKLHWKNQKLLALYCDFLVILGRAEKAFALLSKHKNTQDCVPILRSLAKIYMAKKAYKKAYSLLKKSYYLSPGDPDSIILLERYYCNRKQYDKAKSLFLDSIVECREIYKHNLIGTVRVLCAEKKYNEAVNQLAIYEGGHTLFWSEIQYPEFFQLRTIKYFRRIKRKVKSYNR